jgi:hypothetical protein
VKIITNFLRVCSNLAAFQLYFAIYYDKNKYKKDRRAKKKIKKKKVKRLRGAEE